MSSWGVTCKRERGGAPLYKSQGTLHASRKIKIKHLRDQCESCRVRPKSAIYTPKRDDKHLRHFNMGSSGSPGSLWPRGVQSNRARVKKRRDRKKQTNKQTNKNKLTLGWEPPLFCCEVPIVWNCLLSMKKRRRKNCNSNAKTYSATRATESYKKIFLVPFFFVFVFLFVGWSPGEMEKSTQKWSTALFVCPHTDPKVTLPISPLPPAPTLKAHPTSLLTWWRLQQFQVFC